MDRRTRRTVSTILEYGLWTAILAVALLLEVFPFLLVVMMFNLAVGVPRGPALFLIPVVVIGLVIAACVVATGITRRIGPRAPERRSRPGADAVAPGRLSSPSDYFQEWKRFS